MLPTIWGPWYCKLPTLPLPAGLRAFLSCAHPNPALLPQPCVSSSCRPASLLFFSAYLQENMLSPPPPCLWLLDPLPSAFCPTKKLKSSCSSFIPIVQSHRSLQGMWAATMLLGWEEKGGWGRGAGHTAVPTAEAHQVIVWQAAQWPWWRQVGLLALLFELCCCITPLGSPTAIRPASPLPTLVFHAL